MTKARSTEKELLDLGPGFYSEAEYQDCMRKLFSVNKLLGIFRSTRIFLKRFSAHSSVLDVGCGNGLLALHLSRKFPNMQFQGVDISDDAIKQANIEKEKFPLSENISFYIKETDLSSADIVMTTLVCHHLEDDQLVLFLREMYDVARQAVIIHDLHRHRLAEFFYGFLSPLLFRNHLITHDGLISIRRSFKRQDWQQLLEKSGITHYQIKWCFPFRWRVILWKK